MLKARLATDLSTETWQARKDWHDIFRILNEKKNVAKNTLSSKAVIQNGRRDKELPRQAGTVTSKPALQEILRGTLKIPL